MAENGILGASLSVVFTLVSVGIAWGVMKSKQDQLEEQIRDLRETRSHYVPMDLFKAVVEPLQHDLHEIQRDIKSILTMMKRNGSPHSPE